MHRSAHLLVFVLAVSLTPIALWAPTASAQTPGKNGAVTMLHVLEFGRTVQSSELVVAQPGKPGIARLPAAGGALTGVAWRPGGTSLIGWAQGTPQAGTLATSFRCVYATDCLLPATGLTSDSSSAIPGPLPGATASIVTKSAGTTELVVITPAGRTVLATSPSTSRLSAAWLPAATGEIAYALDGEILRARADGSATTRMLVTGCPGGVGDLDTSPDGVSVAYSCHGGKPGQSALYTARLDGSAYKVLVPMEQDVTGLTWSPDGTTIAYLTSTAPGTYATIPVAGGTPARHQLDETAPYTGVSSIEWQSCTAATKSCGAKPDGSCWRDAVDTFSTDEELRVYSLAECRRFADGHVVRRANGSGEYLMGTEFNDIIVGGRGKDTLDGGAGKDSIKGGRGDDTLVGGPGSDTLVGGVGNDLIKTRDRARDVVSCGPGRDKVIADKADKVATNCETVLRPA